MKLSFLSYINSNFMLINIEKIMDSELFVKIDNIINNINIQSVLSSRRLLLNPFFEFIQKKINSKKEISLIFICTHNSRRSHLCQIWTQVIASHFKIDNINCYSGGTTPTRVSPNVLKNLQDCGFLIETESKNYNPIYNIKFSSTQKSIKCFSKTYDHKPNPINKFTAIMNCTSADKQCPFISGAEARFPLPYGDPKIYDNTAFQQKQYMKTSIEIATEIYYVFSMIKLF